MTDGCAIRGCRGEAVNDHQFSLCEDCWPDGPGDTGGQEELR